MINNVWEEQRMDDPLLNFHEEEMAKMGLPEWIKKIKCPFCDRELPLRSIYGITLKLNTRNMRDVAIEVFCHKCSKMDTIYFRSAAESIEDLTKLLDGQLEPHNDGIIEEKMYKMQYNNVLERMMGVMPREENNDVV